MKTSKLIKAFMAFVINDALAEWCRKASKNPSAAAAAIVHFTANDPADHEWSNLGLIPPIGEESLVHDLDGSAFMLSFQWSERKLPASVRDEEVGKRHKDLVEREGRPLNKKEYAQLKEDVESSLLPQAFIVRKTIPVFVTRTGLFICTSSASMAEKIMIHLMRLCETRKVKFEWSDIVGADTPGFVIGELARKGWLQFGDEEDRILHAGQSAKFKGEDKRTITVKDRDLSSEELQQVLTSGTYATTELALNLEVAGEVVSSFTLTDKLIFKGIKLADVVWAGVSERDEADMHVSYWLFAQEVKRMLLAIMDAMGEATDAATDDDEEL